MRSWAEMAGKTGKGILQWKQMVMIALILVLLCGCAWEEQTKEGVIDEYQVSESSHEKNAWEVFSLDTAEISLPVTYQELEERGWVLAGEESTVGAGEFTQTPTNLKNDAYPDVELRVYFINRDTVEHLKKECEIYGIGVESGTYEKNYDAVPQISIQGICFGSSKEDVVNSLGEADEVNQGKFETSYLYQEGLCVLEFGINDSRGVVRMQIFSLPSIFGRLS